MSIGESFCKTPVGRFANSPTGRLTRFVAGIALMSVGYLMTDTVVGRILLVFGIAPLTTGALDLCVMSAVLGGPLRGATIRQQTR